jgi:hypothetical protein
LVTAVRDLIIDDFTLGTELELQSLPTVVAIAGTRGVGVIAEGALERRHGEHLRGTGEDC